MGRMYILKYYTHFFFNVMEFNCLAENVIIFYHCILYCLMEVNKLAYSLRILFHRKFFLAWQFQ